MTRRSVSHFLLLVLAGLTLGLAIRSCAEAPASAVFVDFGDDWSAGDLRHEAFRLDRPARLAIDAVGSFEDDSETDLAAYGWIVRREDRQVVWQMAPETAEAGRGTLAHAETVLALDAGTYDAYFASYGDPSWHRGGSLADHLRRLLRFGKRPWEAEKSKWAFTLDLADEADEAHAERLTSEDDRDAAPRGPDLLWAAGPAGYGEYRTFGFQIEEPTTLRVEAVGEFLGGPADFGWLDDLSTGHRVWEMTEENTEPAGGAAKNRRFRGTLTLEPGIYRAGYQTDRSHHAGSWNASPPLDPAAYGLFLFTDAPDRVTAFDPWTRLPKLVEMTGIGDDALETASFTLTDSVRAWVYAVGEMSPGSPYDYAWLIHNGDPGSGSGTGETVWEMDYGQTRNAGGAERNRVAEAYVALAPGDYTLHFKTDDSHSPERWRGSPPHNPERWGVTLFALSPDAAPVAVARTSERDVEAIAPAPMAAASGPVELPIRLAPLGSGQEVSRTFTLDRTARLRVYAVGEIIRTDRYDYGWITDGEGEVVWEMTRSNTEPAGGVSKNRKFEGTVRLPAGTYTVHFETDGSHAFGDFGQGPPSDPSAWGITVERGEAPAPPPPPRPDEGATGARVMDV